MAGMDRSDRLLLKRPQSAGTQRDDVVLTSGRMWDLDTGNNRGDRTR